VQHKKKSQRASLQSILERGFSMSNIINEKDCIKVMLKGWLDKQVWKEINDILRVHQFAWLSNGKDSCWIRMMNGKE
jgi:hypothetical protein